jgi:hypothetical protein
MKKLIILVIGLTIVFSSAVYSTINTKKDAKITKTVTCEQCSVVKEKWPTNKKNGKFSKGKNDVKQKMLLKQISKDAAITPKKGNAVPQKSGRDVHPSTQF